MLVYLHAIKVKFVSRGYRSKFTVTGGNVPFSVMGAAN